MINKEQVLQPYLFSPLLPALLSFLVLHILFSSKSQAYFSVCVCVYIVANRLSSCNTQENSYTHAVLPPYLLLSSIALKLCTITKPITSSFSPCHVCFYVKSCIFVLFQASFFSLFFLCVFFQASLSPISSRSFLSLRSFINLHIVIKSPLSSFFTH